MAGVSGLNLTSPGGGGIPGGNLLAKAIFAGAGGGNSGVGAPTSQAAHAGRMLGTMQQMAAGPMRSGNVSMMDPSAYEQRQQMLKLLGLNQLGGSGGLLGQPFFGSVLGNTLPDVVGGVAGQLPGVGVSGSGGGSGGGFGISGGGSGSLFDQLLAGRGQLGQSILGDIDQFGDSQRNQIEQDASNRMGSRLAHLEARGLGGSNIATGEMARTDRERDTALLGLEDQLLGQKIGAKQQIGEGLFGDVGQELDRGVQRSGQAFNLLGNLFSNALNVL